MEYYTAIEKNENFAICGNTDGLGGHYVKLNKSDRERQILYVIIYMWNLKKYNKLVNIQQERSRLTDIENKLVVTSGEREGRRSEVGVGD